MRIMKALFAFALVSSLPAVSMAAAYGTAGCGLGSIVFGDDKGIVQIFAATTNGTFANQTFGITTGTSNCGGGAMASTMDQEVFVKLNYASLQRDVSTGRGEYLSTMAVLLGCDAASHPELFQMAQKSHDQIFTSDADPSAALASLRAEASKSQALKQSCTRL